MKKKFLAVILTALLAVSVSACGDDSSDTSSNASVNNIPAVSDGASQDDNTSKEEDTASKENTESKEENTSSEDGSSVTVDGIGPLTQAGFVDILESKKFNLSMSSELSGQEITLAMVTDGSNLAMNMGMAGQSIVMYMVGDTAYMVDETNKQVLYQKSEQSIEELIESNLSIDSESMNFIESGKGELDGKEYDIEKYDEGDGLVEVIYFDNGSVVAIEVYQNEVLSSTSKISLTSDIPANAFELPSEDEYTYVDASLQ